MRFVVVTSAGTFMRFVADSRDQLKQSSLVVAGGDKVKVFAVGDGETFKEAIKRVARKVASG